MKELSGNEPIELARQRLAQQVASATSFDALNKVIKELGPLLKATKDAQGFSTGNKFPYQHILGYEAYVAPKKLMDLIGQMRKYDQQGEYDANPVLLEEELQYIPAELGIRDVVRRLLSADQAHLKNKRKTK